MNKKYFYGLIASLSCAHAAAQANSFNGHVQTGITTDVHFQGNTQNIAMDNTTTNQYTVSTSKQTDAILGAGLAYQWDHAAFATSLGLSVYRMNSTVSGVNSPSITDGDFDTLNYQATTNSTAIMLEPKFIWTAHAVQPYVLTGAGVSFNHVNDYQESNTVPGSSGVPTLTPFNSETTTAFAYEAGVGVQYAIAEGEQAPMLALDYRYMDWGNTSLAQYSGQTTDNTLNFGHLQTTSVNLSLIWPF